MYAPPCENLRILRCAREFRFGTSAWSAILAGVGDGAGPGTEGASCLSDKPASTVWLMTADLPEGPTALVLKVHAVRTPRDRVRSSLRLSRLRRQWRGSARLSRAGFPAARCRALMTGERDGQRLDVLVMDALPGHTLLDTISSGTLTVARERALADALGKLISGLWISGMHSKDLKPSNLLVDNVAGPGPVALTTIDPDAVGHHPAHPLLPLVLEPSGLGALPRRSAMFRIARAWAWQAWLKGPDRFAPPLERTGRSMESRIARRAWRDLERLVSAHGDARPAHDPRRVPGAEPNAPRAAVG